MYAANAAIAFRHKTRWKNGLAIRKTKNIKNSDSGTKNMFTRTEMQTCRAQLWQIIVSHKAVGM